MKYLILFFFLLSQFTLFAQTQTDLTLASDVWPPFTDVSSEKGVALDIVENGLARAGVQVKYQIIDFEEVVGGINAGHYEGSAALWISEERKEHLIFSDSYLQNQLILVGKKGAEIKSNLDDLKGKKLGVIENYAYGDSLFSHEGIDFVYGRTNQQNLDALLAGELDYMLVDALLIQYLLKYQQTEARQFLEIGIHPVITKTLHMAISKEVEGAAEIIDRFNKEIGEMIKDGTYNDILELNWIQADVDGDGKTELVLRGDAAGLEAPSSFYNIYYSGPNKTNTNRYYINGQFYDSWDQVPEQSKIRIPKVDAPVDPGKGEMRLRLK